MMSVRRSCRTTCGSSPLSQDIRDLRCESLADPVVEEDPDEGVNDLRCGGTICQRRPLGRDLHGPEDLAEHIGLGPLARSLTASLHPGGHQRDWLLEDAVRQRRGRIAGSGRHQEVEFGRPDHGVHRVVRGRVHRQHAAHHSHVTARLPHRLLVKPSAVLSVRGHDRHPAASIPDGSRSRGTPRAPCRQGRAHPGRRRPCSRRPSTSRQRGRRWPRRCRRPSFRAGRRRSCVRGGRTAPAAPLRVGHAARYSTRRVACGV